MKKLLINRELEMLIWENNRCGSSGKTYKSTGKDEMIIYQNK